MPVFFGLRFDLRNPEFAVTPLADRYEAALDMAEWADQRGLNMLLAGANTGAAIAMSKVIAAKRVPFFVVGAAGA